MQLTDMTIALIAMIAVLISAVCNVLKLFGARKLRPHATPTTKNAALLKTNQRTWPWTLLGVCVPLASLAVIISRSGKAVDRWSVLAIAVCIGWLSIQASVYVSYRIIRGFIEER